MVFEAYWRLGGERRGGGVPSSRLFLRDLPGRGEQSERRPCLATVPEDSRSPEEEEDHLGSAESRARGPCWLAPGSLEFGLKRRRERPGR